MDIEQMNKYLGFIKEVIPVAQEIERLNKIRNRIWPCATAIAVFIVKGVVNHPMM